LVLDRLDDLLRDPSHGTVVAEELGRALGTYGARLPVSAFTAVGGDEPVKAAMADAEVEWQVAHTRDFGLEDYLVLFRAAAERRGAETDDETLRTAASLLAASTATEPRNARLVDHLADRAVANARRRQPGAERVELRPSDLPRQIVAETGDHADDEDQERDALAELEALPGLAGVKRVVSTIVAEARAQELRRQAGQRVRSPSRHLIFVGNAGTGKTMVARRLGNVFRQLGLLSRGHVVEVTRTDLVGEFRSETAPKVTAVFERALGGVLFIDEAYTLAPKARGDMGQDATDTLMKLMEDYRDDVVVIAAGFEAPMREFLTANPGLESRFATIVHFPDLTDDELVQVFRSRAAAEGVALGPGAEERVRELLRRTSRGPTFGNARVMRSLLDRAMSAQAHRVLSEERPDPQQLRTLLVEDLPTSLTNRTRTEGGPEPLSELDRMVGLESIKAEVHALVAEAKAEELRRTAGVPIASPTRHLVFTGSPGTAKTTVARLLAAIYADLGLLSSGHLVEVGRSDRVGEYVGQTAPKVTAVVERALGGVLFIDEAYALAGRRGRDEYGAEAIATLLKLMEDNRSDLVVIVAGYEQEMTEFLASNPGLASRFPRIIRFPDYSNDELVAIFASMLESAGLVAGEGLLDRVRQVIVDAPRDRSFGNARFVRNLLDRAIAAQAQRLTAGEDRPSVEEIRTLRSEDLAGALEGDEGAEIPIGQYL
ncbi:MAG TPA: AAA family ATPase, partial [Actinopolymorphaceae bacterium]